MIATQTRDHCRLIATQVASEYGRDKVLKALFEAIVEGLDFGPRDLPRPEDREWIRANIALPLQVATDAALRILEWSVSRALERAPDGLLERYEQSHHLDDMGIESGAEGSAALGPLPVAMTSSEIGP